MTTQEIERMISKYNITDAGNGTLKAVPYGKKNFSEKEIAEIRAAKAEILAYFAEIKKAEADRNAMIAAIDGIKEIETARSEWEEYHYKFNKAMDRGDCRYPSKPTSNVEELKAKYPRATAYLKAQSYKNSSNVGKYSAGKKALERIIDGENFETVLADMETEWTIAAHEAVMNS